MRKGSFSLCRERTAPELLQIRMKTAGIAPMTRIAALHLARVML